MDNVIYICRICVEQNESLKILSEVNVECVNDYLSILNVLKILVGFEVLDSASYYICDRCVELATSFYKFKVLCDGSNKKYRNYLELFRTVKVEKSYSINTCNTRNHQLSEDDLPLSFFTSDWNQSDNDVSDVRKSEKIDSDDNHFINKDENITPKISKKRTRNTSNEIYQFSNCKFCNKLFKNKYVLIAHEKRHENKGKFICNDCGKGFDSKGCLNRHIKVHTGEKKFQCQECQRSFSSSNNLRLHSRRHNGIKPYLCTQCGKSFSHPTGLSYHLRTHSRERPYKCEICGKTFVIKCHLDRHKKIHTGERPFACKQCDRAFIKKIDLQRHEQIHSGERPHTCKICNKSFLRILHLNYHMMVHTSERPHRCMYCGKGFIRRYNLTSHVKKYHSEDPIEGATVL